MWAELSVLLREVGLELGRFGREWEWRAKKTWPEWGKGSSLGCVKIIWCATEWGKKGTNHLKWIQMSRRSSDSNKDWPWVHFWSQIPFGVLALYQLFTTNSPPNPPPPHALPPMSSVSSTDLSATPEHQYQKHPAFQKLFPGVSKMAQCAKALATSLKTWVWFLEPTGWKEKSYSLKLSLSLLMCAVAYFPTNI